LESTIGKHKIFKFSTFLFEKRHDFLVPYYRRSKQRFFQKVPNEALFWSFCQTIGDFSGVALRNCRKNRFTVA